MGNVIEVGEIKICSICHKRQAKYLCDMPVGRIKTSHLKKSNGVTDYENSFKWSTYTCDREICEECAISLGNDIHFCKECMERIKRLN